MKNSFISKFIYTRNFLFLQFKKNGGEKFDIELKFVYKNRLKIDLWRCTD